MRITVLTDNLTEQNNLGTEHGLSCYIETAEKKILFDTGQSDLFFKNAEKLGIDLSIVDTLILSHGHYDHTNGVSRFMQINSQAVILIHPEAFMKKYHSETYIGISESITIPNERIIHPHQFRDRAKTLFIMDSSGIESVDEPNFDGFFVKQEGNTLPDRFEDEIYLAEKTEAGLNLVTGCSHHGIVNILHKARTQFKTNINAVFGGFHLKYSGPHKIEKTGKLLADENIGTLITCHCTGYENFEQLQKTALKNLEYGYCGKTFII